MPIFPLNSVVFPGMTVPLHIFEQKYRAMVSHLQDISDPAERLFAIVAIREGYEVGSHETRSMYRVGCALQLSTLTPYDDGRFDIAAVGRHRVKIDGLDTTGPFVVAEVSDVEEVQPDDATPEAVTEGAARALIAFRAYRDLLSELRGNEVLTGSMPRDPELLSYALAATALLSLRERQTLLECPSTFERLALLRHTLREEIRSMRAIPSIPATEVARTSWNPN